MSFDVFMMVNFHVEVFWAVTPCNAVVGYQRFGEPCCFHLHPGDVDVNCYTESHKRPDLHYTLLDNTMHTHKRGFLIKEVSV